MKTIVNPTRAFSFQRLYKRWTFRRNATGLATATHSEPKPSFFNPHTLNIVPFYKPETTKLPSSLTPKQSTTYNNYLPLSYRQSDAALRYSFNPMDDKKNKLIGSGFFANVYEAKDYVKNQNVAIKAIDKIKCPKPVFQNELNIMQHIQTVRNNKENIIRLRDVFETEEKLCFVLDICRGGDLFDHIYKHGPLNESQAAVVMKQVYTALDTLHTNNIIHRDLKLENVLLSNGNDISDIKITDFGYSKFINSTDIFKNAAGTFGYVAPEVLSSKLYTSKCDMWSSGVVLYTLLTGHLPFPYKPDNSVKGASQGAARKSVVNNELEAILHGRSDRVWDTEITSGSLKGLSKSVKTLLTSLLSIDPLARPTAAECLNSSWLTEAYIEEDKMSSTG